MGTTLDRFKPTLILCSVWVFIGLYFIDAANLDDLLPDTVVFHPEADDSPLDGTEIEFIGDCINAGRSRPAPIQSDQSKKPEGLKIVIDQDSPSLAAEPLVTTISSQAFPEVLIHLPDSFTSSSSLYLLNCTLLI